ncbi:diguanylate cyclase [Sulfurovum sp. ST-21]|uniref:diguanylate cyclase n=1 Tax=Sulfurovum indicum TaxID=2779528 RepID=A0A7M1S1P6_9BACT|nr:diguanylate cyclase [Sulfurovum indicum]QOR61002.1 GGDEF domain-containing protein [Sulfurovum indicum]
MLRTTNLEKEREVLIKKVCLFLFLSTVMLYAEAVVRITGESVNLNTFTLNYFIDHSEKMSLESIKKETFIEGPNRLSLGINAHTTWVKIILENKTEEPKTLFIQDIYVFHSSNTTFYAFDEEERLLDTISFQPRNCVNTDLLEGAVASFKVKLEAHEKQTVYIRSKFLAYQIIDLRILDDKHAKENLVHTFMWVIALTSVLITLAGYYLILFLFSRHREYLYYSLYLISSSVFIAYSYGMVSHYFHLYGKITLYLNATVIVAPIFLALFVKSVFNTSAKHTKENFMLNSLITVFGVTYIYSFFDYYRAIEVTSFIYIYMLVVMLGVALSLLIKKVPLVKYFLVAHIFYIIFSSIALMHYNNIIAFNFLTSHAIAIGTMIEALLLAILVSHRIKILEEANQRKDAILLTDTMTTLYNKSYFEQMLQKQLKVHRDTKKTLGLFVIDIDYFKQYNDTYGHISGDVALRAVANVLKNVLEHPDDMAFRIGGEEFAVICTNTSPQKLSVYAEKILKSIESLKIEHKRSKISKYLTVSIGMYCTDELILKNAKQIYLYADDALYRAKKEGRNRVSKYDIREGNPSLRLSI